VEVTARTLLLIETPGGVGYGAVGLGAERKEAAAAPALQRLGGGSLAEYTAAQETA